MKDLGFAVVKACLAADKLLTVGTVTPKDTEMSEMGQKDTPRSD